LARQALGQVNRRIAAALLLFGTVSSCERAEPSLGVGGAHVVLPAIPGRPGTAYFVIDAGAFGDDPLPYIRHVRVEGVGRAEMHQSMTMHGMARMRPLATVPLTAGVTRFCPGGLHVMLFDLDERLTPGAQTRIHVALSNGRHLDPDARVVALGDTVHAEAPYDCRASG